MKYRLQINSATNSPITENIFCFVVKIPENNAHKIKGTKYIGLFEESKLPNPNNAETVIDNFIDEMQVKTNIKKDAKSFKKENCAILKLLNPLANATRIMPEQMISKLENLNAVPRKRSGSKNEIAQYKNASPTKTFVIVKKIL